MTSLVFIDKNVSNYELLISALPMGTEYYLLDSSLDGVWQIADILQGRENLDSIQIISHGAIGFLYLGASVLNSQTIDDYQQKLQQIGKSLASNGDILLYGCNVAQGDVGLTFINSLAQLTGADIAASENLTGNNLLGGDWTLEQKTGDIESRSLLDPSAQFNYVATLGNFVGNAGDNTLIGSNFNDYLAGGDGKDSLFGEQGNDNLNGQWGDDTLDGGAGNDQLHGGSGNDTYVFGVGSGRDTINEHDDSGQGGNDKVLFSGLSQADVKFEKIGTADLKLTIKATGEVLYVSNEFSGDTGYAIETFSFTDGNLTLEQVNAKFLVGTAGADVLYGYVGNETLSGNGGNDTLNGLWGDDTLDGGAGNDQLHGGSGNDTYVFGVGSGRDTINEHDDSGQGGNDKVLFSGLSQADVKFEKIGTADLKLTIKATGEVLYVSNEFSGDTGYAIETFSFTDGNLTLEQVNAKFLVGTAGADVLYGYVGNETLSGNGGNDTLNGLWGDDTLDGGAGNDQLHGGSGNDTYVFGVGSGRDTINEHDDSGQGGNDKVLFSGLSQADVKFEKIGTADLKLTIKATGEVLYVSNEFSGDTGYAIETFSFTDGNLTLEQVNAKFLVGTAGADVLYGYVGNETLSGNGGNDTLNGLWGDDTLDGGAGNDQLHGGSGNDTYVFGVGSGRDTINEHDDSGQGGNDKVLFSGLSQADVKFEKIGTADLKLTIKATGEVLYVSNEFSGDTGYAIETFSFADGDLNRDQVNALATFGNRLVLTGTIGADTLTGNDGNDTLYGLAGNDSLDGGAGDDTLYGGAGDDTYRFGIGSGQDRIQEDDGRSGRGGTDQVIFTGLNQADVSFEKVNTYDLRITINSTGESLYIKDQFYPDTSYNIETLLFADGTVTPAQINEQLSTGGSSDDTLFGWTGNDTLTGNQGNDQLYGLAGNDALDGGIGDDTLYGGAGDDTYRFGIGSGQDRIQEDDGRSGRGGTDQVIFTGLNQADVSFEKVNTYDLRITINSTGESLYIKDQFYPDTSYNIETLVFADGTVTPAQINEQLSTGGSSDDTLFGWTGNDTLTGNQGNDQLYGLAGNDALDGGIGDDTLYGGAGDDTYRFGIGSGQDRIQEDDGRSGRGGTDQVIFTGLNQADVSFEKVNTYDLRITINSTGESLYIQDQFYPDASFNIETFVFVDGTVTPAQINEQLSTGGSSDDTLFGWTGNDTLTGNQGNDQLYGLWGNDSLDGGAGDDTLYGGVGDDTYRFGIGSGQDRIQEDDGRSGRGGTDQVIFIGLNQADVSFEKVNTYDLRITINSTGESLYIQDQFYPDASFNIETFVFVDGTVTPAQINEQLSTGGSSDDTLFGWTGDDTLVGGDGYDKLYGGNGNDTLIGGNAGTNSDTNGNELYGEDGNDILTGGDLSGFGDILSGGNGNDTLSGLAGNDLLNGDSGSDSLLGGDGNDTLKDYTNNIDGVADINTLSGGVGDDQFYIYSPDRLDSSTLTGGNGRDIYHLQLDNVSTVNVTDFAVGAVGDVIDISSFINAIGSAPFDPLSGYLRLRQDGANTLLELDPDRVSNSAQGWRTALVLQNVIATSLTHDNFTPAMQLNGVGLDTSSIAENSPADTVVGHLYTYGLGLDGSHTLSYTLLDNADGRFTLVGNELRVAAGAILDYESAHSYPVVILAADGQGVSVTSNLNIALNNINEAPTSLSLSTTKIDEASLVNGLFVANVSASDPDVGDSLHYNLLDDAGGRFTLVGSQLRITDASLFDFTTQANYTVTLKVIDADGLSLSKDFNISLERHPDLAVTQIDGPQSARSGERIQFSWIDGNPGLAGADTTWTDKVYLDDPNTGDLDRLVGTFNFTGNIPAGGSIERIQTLALPSDLPSGDYRFVVVTDVNNSVNEGVTGEANNTTISTQTIHISPELKPNLQVGSVTVPTTAFTGHSIEVQWTVTNAGTAATTTPVWNDGVYLSADNVFDSKDIYLGSATNAAYLDVGQTYNNNATVSLPKLEGDYHILVVADRNAQVSEGNENDNVRASATLTIQPIPIAELSDLAVISVAAPAQAFSGQRLNLTYTIDNAGQAAIAGDIKFPEWVEQIYMSKDDVLDASDTLLQTIARDLYYQTVVWVDLPFHDLLGGGVGGNGIGSPLNSSEPQGYYIWVDDPNYILPLAGAGSSGGSIGGFSFPGTSSTQRHGYYKYGYYKYETVNDLPQANNATHFTTTESVTLPVGESGDYTFFVRVIPVAPVSNVFASNDVGFDSTPTVVHLTPPPDLMTESVGVPGTALAGHTLNFSYHVSNRGLSSTPNTNWTDAVYLSLDSLLDANDIKLTELNHSGALQPNEAYSNTATLTLPNGITGNYYLIVSADSKNEVFEQDNANNAVSSAAITINSQPADLLVNTVAMPTTGQAGNAVLLSWQVSNQGTGDSIANAWTDAIIASTDAIIGNADDVLLATFAHQGLLNPGEHYNRNELVVLPNSLSGNYSIFAVTDFNHQVFEADQENNNATAPSNLLNILASPSDLQVSSVSTPATADSGRAINIAYTVKNLANRTEANYWTDTITLSTDAVLGNADDVILDTVGHYGTLDFNQTYSVNRNFALPNDLQGIFNVFVTADVNHRVQDSVLGNNSLQAANTLTVVLSAMPDLVISSLDAANQAVSGQNLALSWTIKNNGAPTNSTYRTVFYLSPDQVLDRDSDIYLGYADSFNPLATSATLSNSINLHIPSGLSGTYQVYAVVDSNDGIYERDGESNNVAHDSTPVAISLPPLTDLVAGTITVPQTNLLGQQASITYTVTNQSADNLNSSWQDSVYLSLDDVWDVRDQLFARVDISKNLNPGDSYTQTVSGQLPGLAVGNYQVIVRSDIRNVIPESNEANNLKASVDAVKVDVAQLSLGSAANGSIGAANSAYYRVDVAAGETLKVAFDSVSATGRTELFIRHGDIPSRANFDYRYSVADSPDQSITIPNTQAGTYYIMAYNADSAASAYSITADTLHFGIDDLSLHQGSNKGQVTVRIDGAEFTTHTNAQLIGADGVAHAAQQIVWKDGSELWATFDLRGMAVGAYDLKLTDDTHTAVLSDGFNVISGTLGHVEYGMETPPALRAIRNSSSSEQGTVRVYYKNTGDTDVAAPVLNVSGNVLLKLPQDSQFTANSVQFLAVDSEGGPAGILAPGAEGSYELIFKANFAGTGSVNLGVSSLAGNQSMDWASILETAKPDGIDAAAWSKIKANLIQELGSSTTDYQTLLDSNATQQDALEGRTNSVEDLFRMAFLRATNNGALLQDTEIGVLGRGRSFDWDITATQQGNGDVLVKIGGLQQRFVLQTNGSYTSDGSSTLSKQYGVFTLQQLGGGKIDFNADGTFHAVVDSNGNVLQATYNAAGQLSQVSNAFGASQTFIYNQQGRLITITDQDGHVTSFAYDTNAEFLTDITTQNGTTHYDYVGTGSTQQVSTITLPNGTVQHFEYNSAGQLLKQSVNTGQQTTTYEYVGVNEVLVKDAQGHTTHLWLNDRGQIAQVENPLGQVTQLHYDTKGNLIATINPDGTVSQISYDGNNNPLSVQDALGHSVNFAYNPQNGQLANVSDQRGNPLSYSYDVNGNLNQITYADGSKEQYSYNDDGTLSGMVNRRGDGISYRYDAKGKLLEKTYADGSKASYGYDAHGNLTLATDADSSTSFQYDSYDRLIKTTDTEGRWLSYGYDSVGRKSLMSDSAGHTTHYRYNDQGLLDRLSDANDNTIASYQYDENGRLSRGDNGNGTYTTYQYDAAGQLTHLINFKADDSINSRFDYTYNEVGQRTSMTTLDGTTHYDYDATGQLTGVTLPDSRHIEYRYDAAGNRITVSDSGVTTDYATNALNQYTDVGNAKYAYDKDGNLSSKTEGGVTTTYAYDDENHLIGVSTPGDTWHYEYDALGNRIASIHNGVRTEYQLDPTGMVNVVAEYDGAGQLSAVYTHGLGLEARSDAGGNDYYDFDALGSTTGLTNATGSYVDRYSYLPFGENLTTNEAVANPFEYVGQWGVMDAGNGLDFMRARFYNADEGRFLSVDPIGINGGENLYKYANNQPTLWTDLLGLNPGDTAVIMYRPIDMMGLQNYPYTTTITGYLDVDTVHKQVVFYNKNGEIIDNKGVGVGPDGKDDISSNYDFITNSDGSVTIYDGDTMRAAIQRVGNWDFQSFPPSSPFKNGGNCQAYIHAIQSKYSELDVWHNLNFWDHLADWWVGNRDSLWDNIMNGLISIISPKDPNDILHPEGFGADHWLSADDAIPYTIRFENQATATAPAQEVTITEKLDSDLDINSFRLGDFGWGDISIHVPDNTAFYINRLDLTATKGFLVDIIAGIDVAKGEIFWTFTTIDPKTGEIPVDPSIGFLPTNVDKGTGEGFVNYSIKPKADVSTGAVINAHATIVFTSQEPIDTPAVFNTLDADKPLSQVQAATATETVASPEFLVRWSGSDAGSAIAGYTVYVSDNGGAYTSWLTNTQLTEASYQGQNGHRYAFYSLATDNAGNREVAPEQADVIVNVDTGGPAVTELIPPANGRYALGSNLDIAVRFNEAVTVNLGSLAPSLALLIGNTSVTAAYLSGNGTDTLLFRHTVQAGEYDSDGIVIGNAIALNGSSITDLAGNPADLALVAVDTTGIVINNAPELTLQGGSQTLEGIDYQLTIQTADADTGNAGLSLSIDWADGSALQTLTAAELSALGGVVSHLYLDGNADLVNPTAYTIQVTATDPLGVQTQQSHSLLVGNVAPNLTVSGADKVDEGQAYQLNLGSITDPGQDTVNQIIVHWGDGSQNSYTGLSNVSHVFANGGVVRHINVDLIDEDGQYNAVAGKTVAIYDTETFGNAPATISKANPNGWINAWSASDVSISHKTNVNNTGEGWSAVSLNALNVNALNGGDIYGGDLGVSGKSLNTSSVSQEIDGSEALRFSLTHLAHEAQISLSRLFSNDDSLNGLSEEGRLQAYNGNTLVGETVFRGDSPNGQKLFVLDVNQGFDSLVFTAGAYNNQSQFVSGAYDNAEGQFASVPYSTGTGLHGSDYLVDVLLIGVKPEEILV